MTPDAVPILTYHSLDESGSVISLSPAAFRLQMHSLRARGFEGLALRDLLDAWDGRRSFARPVVLTFDDGFRSVAEQAQPVLAELGFRATVFVVAGRCGGWNDWPGQPPALPRLPLLARDELRALERGGVFEIGSHGFDHVRLERARDDVLEREVAASRQDLEALLGHEVALFAYPYGRFDAGAYERVRAQYRAACGVRLATARRGDDRHALPRLDTYYLRHPRLFRFLGTPLGRAYLGLRAAGRRVKQALE